MKPVAVLFALFVPLSPAADLNPKLLRLIGPDARMVTGADLDRQGRSELSGFFHPHVVPDSEVTGTYQVLWIESVSADRPTTPLTVVIGTLPPQDPEVPIPEFTALDANTKLWGDPDKIVEAQVRFSVSQPLSEMASKARRLSQSYDNWFLIVKPLASIATPPRGVQGDAPAFKYRQDLIEAVEEVSGGVRFGSVNEVGLEVVFRDSEDALAAAALARWLPGLLQLDPGYNSPGELVDAIEDFTVHADGKRVSLSLRIPEEKVHAIIEARKPRID